MAQEYIALREANDLGTIALSTSAFQTIANIVIQEDCNLKLAEISKPFKYPVTCKIVTERLTLTIDVKVKYSANVNDACAKVQSKIFENIEHMTGYTPDVIDIRVVGFIF